MSPVRVKPPAVLCSSESHITCPPAAVRPRSMLVVMSCGRSWKPFCGFQGGVGAAVVHTAGSVHRTDRSRRGSCGGASACSPPAPMRVDGARRAPATVCACPRRHEPADSTPSEARSARGRPIPAPGLSSARGPPAYAARARSTAPAGTRPFAVIPPERNDQLARQRDDAHAARPRAPAPEPAQIPLRQVALRLPLHPDPRGFHRHRGAPPPARRD